MGAFGYLRHIHRRTNSGPDKTGTATLSVKQVHFDSPNSFRKWL